MTTAFRLTIGARPYGLLNIVKPTFMDTTTPRIVILGATGMLGSMLYRLLKDKYQLTITYRDPAKLRLLYEAYGQSSARELQFDVASLYQDYLNGFQGQLVGPNTRVVLDSIRDADWVINAIGITKPHSLTDPALTMFINGALPHVLSTQLGKRLIHITTDCVFDGSEGAPYTESSARRPVDLYGLSKLLGEPTGSLVLRTSIIGPELGGGSEGLLGWFLSQAGGQIKGFTNHFWNGVTTLEFANICDRLVSGQVNYPGPGVYHVFSTAVNKHEMVEKFKTVYDVAVEIEPFVAPMGVDRRLGTRQDFNAQLNIPSFDQMVSDLAAISTNAPVRD